MALIPSRACGATIVSVGPTVLLVDDSASFRWFARELLDTEGFVVIGEAESGLAALEAVNRLDPDIVLLDVACRTSTDLRCARGSPGRAWPVRPSC